MNWLKGAAMALYLKWRVFRFKRSVGLLNPTLIMDFEDYLLYSHFTATWFKGVTVVMDAHSMREH